MLGLLVIIIVSWVLLHLIEKKNIDVLGIVPSFKSLGQFALGFLVISIIVLLNIFFETQILNVEWESKTIDYAIFFNAFLYHLKSALTEDLVFRGAILYILINRLGAKWGVLISALCFGIYHVFSYGMASDRIVPILYVIIITGFTGYVWAYTFYKTKSIMMGLGFHLGVNLINACFFESQPYGELIFTEVSRINISEWNNFLFLIFKGLFPSIFTLIFIKYLLKSS
ncbi:CPBP family intramembrane glutamic endopeptidase [Hanstruepera ponticola]|uniref:CPBP family intramembrane glutamic endopeptidase n=1 Tax=Hanstruepera ponticola TaxID=2042995 RepID=UPI000CF1B0AA|nr:CPBP family intramembrane glutamic endopeptidase [Hanstruepera ponticola]